MTATSNNTSYSGWYRRYGFFWVTGGFFVISIVGHWVFGWFAFVNEQASLGKHAAVADFVIEMMRDTLENWQSEFLQLIWQVAGLALLLHIGSPQSKEGDDRMEAKLDAILLAVAPERAEQTIEAIDDAYEGRDTDTELERRLSRSIRQ